MADGGSLHNVPLVLDNGSGTIRAGFAGTDLPAAYFPSYVGRPKHVRALAGALEGDVFIGPKAQELRGLLKNTIPSRTWHCHRLGRHGEDMDICLRARIEDPERRAPSSPDRATSKSETKSRHGSTNTV